MVRLSDLIKDLAPYIAGIVAAVVSYLGYKESIRKTRHDELHDLYIEVKAESDKLKEENEQLRKELEHDGNSKS